MHGLTGYTDRWSVKQNGAIRFMVSSAGGRDFSLRFVRHLCADPNPAGPGYAEVSMPSALDGTRQGIAQAAFLGSFGHVAALPADLRGGVRLAAAIWPTTPRKGRQGLVAVRIGGWSFALGIGPGGGAMAEVRGGGWGRGSYRGHAAVA
jgi:N,N-dimethylformamidase